VKKYVEKRLLKMFLTEDKVLIGYKDTDQNIKTFNFVYHCSGIVSSNTTGTRVSDVTAVTFFVNPLKLSSVRKHLQKVVCFIIFIYSRAFNNTVIFNGKPHCCNDTFTDVIDASKEHLRKIQRKIQIILCC